MDAIVSSNNRHGHGNGYHELSEQLLATQNVLSNQVEASTNDVKATAQRDAIAGSQQAQAIGMDANGTAQRLSAQGTEEVERMGIMNRDAIEHNGDVDRNVAEQFALNNLSNQGRISDNLSSEVERFGMANQAATHGVGEKVEKFGLYNAGVSQSVGDKVEEHVERSGQSNQSKTQFYGHENFKAIKDGLKDTLLQGCGNTDKILLNQVSGFKDGLLKSCEDTASIIHGQTVGFKDGLLQNCHDTASIIQNENSNFKDTVLQAANNASAIQATVRDGVCKIEKEIAFVKGSLELQAANNKACLELDAAKNLASIQLTATINAKDAALTAAQNAAAIAKQLAECCCENKELIRESRCHTDELVRKLDENRVRDELAKTREELTALRLRASLAPPPVAAVNL